MRTITLILTGLTLAGCVHSQPAVKKTTVSFDESVPEYEAEAVAASALVFQPPVGDEELEPVLARDDRQPSAFLGYDDGIAEYFYLRIDDRQSDRHFNNYERRAVSERSGVRYH